MKEENDIFNKITSKAKTLKLTEKERSVLFSRIDSYVKRNPVLVANAGNKGTHNEIKWFSYLFESYSRTISFALVVFIVFGGSVSAAAGNALPGSFFYPIKVNVNEEIKSAFVSSANKVAYEAERATLRISEAETLARKGSLSLKAKAQVEQYFDTHVAKVESSIEKYKENGEFKKAFETSSNLEISLKNKEESLANANNFSDEKSSEQLKNVMSIVQATISSSSLVREQVEQIIVDSDEDNDDVRVVAETRLSAVKTLVGDLNNKEAVVTKVAPKSGVGIESDAAFSSDVTLMTAQTSVMETPTETPQDPDEEIATWLLESGALTAEGEEKMKQGLYKEANALFKRAYNVAEEAKILKQLQEIEDVDIDN